MFFRLFASTAFLLLLLPVAALKNSWDGSGANSLNNEVDIDSASGHGPTDADQGSGHRADADDEDNWGSTSGTTPKSTDVEDDLDVASGVDFNIDNRRLAPSTSTTVRRSSSIVPVTSSSSTSDTTSTSFSTSFTSTTTSAMSSTTTKAKTLSSTKMFVTLPGIDIDDADDSVDEMSGSGVEEKQSGSTTVKMSSSTESITTSSSTSTTSSPTTTTSTTQSTTAEKPSSTKMNVVPPDVDIDDDDDEEMSGSGVEERPQTEKPTVRPIGPCTAKEIEHKKKSKPFPHRCLEDGYFSEVLCEKKCKCYFRDTGKRDHDRVYDEERKECVDGLSRKKGSDGNLLTENPVLFAAIIGGSVVGLLVLILLVMFIVYRMRKKDEGSYALDTHKKPATHSYHRCPQEYYA